VLGGPDYERREIAAVLRDPAFALTAARDGLLRFERGAPAGLRQEVQVAPANDLPPQTAYFGPIRLLGAEIAQLGGGRLRASFAWTSTGELPADRSLLPVSRLEGVAGARIVHLPTYALRPTAEWRQGEIIRESFELQLPPDIPAGRYTWLVAWYDPASGEAYATDERSAFAGAPPAIVAELVIAQERS
jgi:hypothetical protein